VRTHALDAECAPPLEPDAVFPGVLGYVH
jgi:hypothetical protein